jgi:hypothetical protein
MTEKIEGWAVLKTFSYEHQAEIIKGHLESRGIECMVYSQKDHVNVVFVGDLSEIKVLVPENQFDAAMEAIKDFELLESEVTDEDDEVTEWESEPEDENEDNESHKES